MKVRVKSNDHINLDALTPGQLSLIQRGLQKILDEVTGTDNHSTFGLASTMNSEIKEALEEAEAITMGKGKEYRQKQREAETAALRKASKVDDIMEKSRKEFEKMVGGDSLDQDMAAAALEVLEQEAEDNYHESHIENQAGYMGSEQHQADLAAADDRCG